MNHTRPSPPPATTIAPRVPVFAPHRRTALAIGLLTLTVAAQHARAVVLQPFGVYDAISLAGGNYNNQDGNHGSFIGTNLSGASLVSTNLSSANLTNVNLYLATLTNTNLAAANLHNAYLEGTVITAAQLSSAADVTGINLRAVNLSGFALNGLDFSAAYLHSANFSSANLNGTKLAAANFYNANLQNADLRNGTVANAITVAQLSLAANITGVNLSGNNLSGATLSGLNLSGANLSSVDLSLANLSSANLSGANLHNTDLRNANAATAVTNAQLNGASDVTGIILSGNNLSTYVLNGKDLSGARLVSTNLTAANLSGANLSGADLSGANLFNTSLASANLVGATVGTALLRYADFTDANLTGVALGDATRFDGFIYEGRLDLGVGTTTLNSLGFANLGTLTTIAGGTLAAPNGVSLGVGRNVVGAGAVTGKVAAATGSTIFATGNLALGNAASPVGFTTDGELYTNANTVTLHDSNQAVLGPLTQLGSGGVAGTLNAAHGVYVDFGRNLVGQGTVNSNNLLADAVLINGSVQGIGTGLLFTGYVKGQGTFSGSVTFGGTYSPGLSPALVHFDDMNLLATSTLVMELGGLGAGSQYDQIDISGTAALAGMLDVELINGFTPAMGNTFDLFDGLLDGAFGSVQLPVLGAGLSWNTSELSQNGTVSVVPEPSSLALLGLGALGMGIRRRGLRG